MKQILVIITLVLCCWQCKKSDIEGDLSGKEYIRGRLFLYDTITQQAAGIPLGKKKISVGYAGSSDTLNFLFSTTTDDDGYFIFQHLKPNTSYRLFYEDSTNGVIHEAIAITNAPVDALRLIANVSFKRQNGIHIRVTDPNKGVLANANVCLFNSPLAIGFANNTCDGANYKLVSDGSGHAFKFSVPPGRYYINSSLEIGGVPLFSKDTIDVGNSIKFDTIQLKLPNGMRFTVLDSLGTRISGASICVFTSLALYQQDTCAGSNFQLLSGINGQVAKYNIDPNTYYIYSTYITPNFIWVARDTLQLTNQIINDTLILRKK